MQTYWCNWDVPSQNFTNCCADDAPTISGMLSVFEKLLQLPHTLTTQQQRDEWTVFQRRIPPLPVDPAAKSILPARVVSSGTHNSEGPELCVMPPPMMADSDCNAAAATQFTRTACSPAASRSLLASTSHSLCPLSHAAPGPSRTRAGITG